MVMKFSTHEGVPLHVDIPKPFIAAVLTLTTTIVVGLGGLLVSNQQELADHRLRLEYIESSRFTAEDARALDQEFVTVREFEIFSERLTRIEDKLDRLLEGR